MYETLYRKYRPKTFAELSGQDTIKKILQNEVVSGRVAHAYLFSGSRGVGKTSVARILTRAINCLNRGALEAEPCNNCNSCLTISEGKCFDVLEIDAASHTGVDNVRENIIEGSRFPPAASKYKVFIIDEVHMLSRGAFNALLKTLEEAPVQTVFILATTELHKVPETVASRCEHFAFSKIPSGALAARLQIIADKERVRLDEEVIQAITNATDGSLRNAESLLGQLIASVGSSSQITLNEVELVIPKSNKNAASHFYELLREKNTAGALKLVNDLIEEGIDVEKFYDDCISFGRELILENPTGNTEFIKFLQALLEKKSLMRFSPLPQIPLELVVVDFCNHTTSPNLKMGNPALSSDFKAGNPALSPNLKISNPTLPPPIRGGPPRVDSSRVEAGPASTRLGEAGEEGLSIRPFVSITLDQIKERWEEFLEKISSENHSLPLILRLAEPLEIIGSTLKIAVQYRFHRERLNEIKTRQIVEKLFGEIFKAPLRIEAIVREETRENQPTILHSVLQEFGGRVVE